MTRTYEEIANDMRDLLMEFNEKAEHEELTGGAYYMIVNQTEEEDEDGNAGFNLHSGIVGKASLLADGASRDENFEKMVEISAQHSMLGMLEKMIGGNE